MENVVLSQAEYLELVDAADKYHALKAAGVDNWSGYSEAMKSLEEE